MRRSESVSESLMQNVKVPLDNLVTQFLFVGDSLSDCGEMARRKLMDVIPMGLVSGLSSKTVNGSFTNGRVWLQQMLKNLAAEMGFGDLSLDNPAEITFREGEKSGVVWARTYCEGGVTSHNYFGEVRANPVYAAEGVILNNLDSLRDRIKKYNRDALISPQERASTLVFEWTGANDLLTINASAEIRPVENAIAAKMKHLKEMVAMGYKKFMLINMPDLSLVPRFQKDDVAEMDRRQVKTAVEVFNRRLAEEIAIFKRANPGCMVELCDVNTLYSDAYNNPAKYQLDPKKLKTPYVETRDFDRANPSSARGYSSWDDVHPTEYVHGVLSNHVVSQVKRVFTITQPSDTLVTMFRERYATQLEEDQSGCFGMFVSPKFAYKKEKLTLHEILDHALENPKGRTRKVIQDLLGWVDKRGMCVTQNALVVTAMRDVMHVREERKAQKTSKICCTC